MRVDNKNVKAQSPVVLGNHLQFPPGFLAYRLPNTLSVIGSPGREDLNFPAAFSRSLVAPYLGNITLEGSGKLLSRLTGHKQCTVAGVCSIPTLELTGDTFPAGFPDRVSPPIAPVALLGSGQPGFTL